VGGNEVEMAWTRTREWPITPSATAPFANEPYGEESGKAY